MNTAHSPKLISLKPHDVCVGLQLLLTPGAQFRELAADVGLSLGETHNAAKRLEIARLVIPGRRGVHGRPLLDFIIHGVPFAFPGLLGSELRGVPTAYSGPPFKELMRSHEPIVWPSSDGDTRGVALAPLCAGAPAMPKTNPPLYRLLTIVDALRVGRSREQKLGRQLLEQEIRSRTHPDSHDDEF
jgi:hypothetical protein